MARAKLQQVEQAPEVSGGVEEIVIQGSDVGSLDDLNLDSMFDELEAALPETVKLVGAPEVQTTVIEHQHVAAGKSVTDDELKALAMAELEESNQPLSDDAKIPEAKTKKVAVIANTKRIPTLGMSLSVALATALGEQLDTILVLDDRWIGLSDEELFEKRMAVMEAIDAPSFPKKIGEKVINVFAAVAKGATLSVYTQMAIDLLVKDGEMTSKSLKDAYIARPYSEGTASSQATQMMKLLPALGIATAVAGKLSVNDHSTLLPALRSTVA